MTLKKKKDFYFKQNRADFPPVLKSADILAFDIDWLLFLLICCYSTVDRLEASCLLDGYVVLGFTGSLIADCLCGKKVETVRRH